MQKKGFTIVEVCVVFLLILGVTFIVVPKSLDSTRQAKLISKWGQKYSEMQYTYSVIKAQQNGEITTKLNNVNDNGSKELILLEVIKPYLRISSQVDGGYAQHYMNKKQVTANDAYFFDKFYFSNLNEILGLKWINKNCKKNETCAIISFDVNGITPPNTWGQDVFGVNIFNDRIEPIGQGVSPEILKFDCSKGGTGVYCSYYYLIGGNFD